MKNYLERKTSLLILWIIFSSVHIATAQRWEKAQEIIESIQEPTFPNRSFNVRDLETAENYFNDDCDEVRAMAAWTLIRNGKKKAGLKCLQALLTNKSYATLTVLNMIDWIGEDARILKDYIPEEDELGENEKRMNDILNTIPE